MMILMKVSSFLLVSFVFLEVSKVLGEKRGAGSANNAVLLPEPPIQLLKNFANSPDVKAPETRERIDVIAKSVGAFTDLNTFIDRNPDKNLNDYAALKGFDNFNQKYEGYVKKFRKTYKEKEVTTRQVQILASIKQINDTKEKNLPYELGLNSLADIYEDEYLNRLGAPIPSEELDDDSFHNESNAYDLSNVQILERRKRQADLPEEWDWRKQGVILPAWDQGNCMSCWAFSSCAAIEAQVGIRKGESVMKRLSPQQLLDCIQSQENNCRVGYWPKDAMKNVLAKLDGYVASLDQYPYNKPPKQGECKKIRSDIRVLSSHVQLPKGSSDESIMEAIKNNGPATVVMKFDAFKLYKKGVVFNKECTITDTHAVTLIGWGNDKSGGGEYWLIKNSFGPAWGEDGYLRVARNKNECHINNYVTYPVLQ